MAETLRVTRLVTHIVPGDSSKNAKLGKGARILMTVNRFYWALELPFYYAD